MRKLLTLFSLAMMTYAVWADYGVGERLTATTIQNGDKVIIEAVHSTRVYGNFIQEADDNTYMWKPGLNDKCVWEVIAVPSTTNRYYFRNVVTGNYMAGTNTAPVTVADINDAAPVRIGYKDQYYTWKVPAQSGDGIRIPEGWDENSVTLTNMASGSGWFYGNANGGTNFKNSNATYNIQWNLFRAVEGNNITYTKGKRINPTQIADGTLFAIEATTEETLHNHYIKEDTDNSRIKWAEAFDAKSVWKAISAGQTISKNGSSTTGFCLENVATGHYMGGEGSKNNNSTYVTPVQSNADNKYILGIYGKGKPYGWNTSAEWDDNSGTIFVSRTYTSATENVDWFLRNDSDKKATGNFGAQTGTGNFYWNFYDVQSNCYDEYDTPYTSAIINNATHTGVTINNITYDLKKSPTANIACPTTANGSKNIEHLYIPSTVEYLGETYKLTEIPSVAFDGGKFSTVEFESPSNIVMIQDCAFRNCYKVTEFTLPEGAKHFMYNRPFPCGVGGTSLLEKITCPSTTERIQDYAFAAVSNLKLISFKGETPPTFTGSHLFTGTTKSDITVVVPNETAKTAYAAVALLDGVKEIITEAEYVSRNVVENNGNVTVTGLLGDDNIGAFSNYINSNYANATSVDFTNASLFPSLKKANITEFQTDNNNTVVIVPAAKTEFADNNIVIGDECTNLVLTEGKPFSAPTEFTATTATYTRSIGNAWGTICLPYPVSSDENVTYYTTGTINGDVLTLTSTDEVPAGTPAIFKASGRNLTAAGSNVTVKGTVQTESVTDDPITLIGTFKEQVISASDVPNAYYISGGKFWHATGTLTVKPFRAYFTANTVAPSNGFSIAVDDDDVTAIQALTGEGDTTIVAIYAADGKQISDLQKGLNIVKLSNGNTKKIILN